jgi:hypothetical protein
MKKLLSGIIVLIICLGFTACDVLVSKGGTVKIKNDTAYRTYFEIRFKGVVQRVSNGAYYIDPGMTVQAVSEVDTTYAVYLGSSSIYVPSVKYGDLVGGETISVMVSDYVH